MTQLIPIRSQVVAPEDYYLLSVDLSSAEAWVVAYLADEPRMKKALAGNIMHETSACVLFEMDLIECKEDYVGSKDQRYLGKKYNHACNYRMGYIRAAEIINKESDKPPYVTVTTKQSQIYHKRWNEFYRLRPWWMEIEDKLKLDHYLITPYGRKREFFDPLGDDLYKKATAFIPQSTIWDHLSGRVQKEIGMEGGLKSIYRDLVVPSNGSIRITNTSHDSVILEVPKPSIKDVAEQCLKYLTRPLMINGEVFTIPADAEYGERWGELEPIKA